jgi:hypothetical protein
MIAKAIKWGNGMVMVFDISGAQVPNLQGPYTEVRDRVLAAAGDETVFVHGIWDDAYVDVVSRDAW